ncbi:TonB-dependent receptor [Kaistella anthropi]|nr:TonB-dependent receptor [Kaistella anthropi]
MKWGKSEQTNFGIDMGFLNGRLTLTADYFIKKSKDQIFEVPLPITAGYKTTFINAGFLRIKDTRSVSTFRDRAEERFLQL